MRRSSRAAAVVGGAALVLAACQADPASGPGTIVGAPMLDMALAPAGNAVFPSVSGQRITAAAARDTIEFTVNDAPPTGSGNTYQIVLVDTATGRATGTISRIIRTMRRRLTVSPDSSVLLVSADTSTGAQFSIPDTATTVVVRIANAAIPNYNFVVLRTAGEGSVPTTIGGARTGFLSFRYKSGSTYAAQPGTFGSFAAATADRLPFVVAADVIGAGFWGDWLRIDVRNLGRPPAGFRYACWMVDARSGAATRLGGLLAPAPESRSLDDADLGMGAWFNGALVVAARVRANLRTLGIAPQDFTFTTLVLEPYGGFALPTRPGRTYVLSAPVPPSVRRLSVRAAAAVARMSGTTRDGDSVFGTRRTP